MSRKKAGSFPPLRYQRQVGQHINKLKKLVRHESGRLHQKKAASWKS
ncbi:hypothetical protein [Niabella terrae]